MSSLQPIGTLSGSLQPGTIPQTDYNNLNNKPKINDVELSGNVSLEDIGVAESADTLAGYGITDAYTKAEVDAKETAMTANVGNLNNLTTTTKTNLVAAVNELDGNIDALIDSVSKSEATMTATRAYAVGDYINVNGKLYRATNAIASGATLSTSTNVEETTIGDELRANAQSIATAAEQIASNAEEITNVKADFSQLPTDGVTANSKQLLSENGMDNTEPYMLRAVPVNADREEMNAMVGGTVAWNQLAHNFVQRTNALGITITPNSSDGSITITGTATATNTLYFETNIAIKLNHVYLIWGAKAHGISISGFSAIDIGNGAIIKSSQEITNAQFVYGFTSGDVINETIYPQRIDLTAMFGSTIADYIYSLEQASAGAGVAWFRKLFPADYYPFDAGSLKSVEGVSSHDMVGFNQWDEEWEVGGIDITTGANVGDNTRLRSKNLIPVLPNVQYYVSGVRAKIYYYDASGTFLSSPAPYYGPGFTFTPDSNTRFVRWQSNNQYGTTYNHDICINLSDPAKNGTYKPYEKRSYPLDSSLTLRGIPKLDSANNLYYDGDTYESDGTVTRRYGVVDLGTLTYVKDTALERVDRFWAELNIVRKPNDDNVNDAPKALCPKFVSIDLVTANTNYMIGVVTQYRNRLYFFTASNTYAGAMDFKTAMSGVMLVYELATPTTETATPYQSLQVCDPNGTEEFVSTGIVPVGHETFYPENLRAKIEGLPWDFSALIAPTETGTASRNYTVGSLLIMGNVLYKVTANIANGGAITPGTNCTATTLSEVISALQ